MFADIEQREIEVDKLQVAKLVTGTLRDLSARKLEQLRAAYQKNRELYDALSATYRLVRFEAQKQGIASPAIRAGTSLAIAFTSNKHFYGSLNRDVVLKFLKVAGKDANLLVIGETGRKYVEDLDGIDAKRVKFMNFDDDLPTDREIYDLIRRTETFEHIHFHYSRFETVFTQVPVAEDITYAPIEDVPPGEAVKYFFEPEIPEMLHFFDTHVRYTLLKQIVLDVEVARTAARMMAMNRAEEQADDLVREAEKALYREFMSMSTKRILNTYAGLHTWSHD